MIAECDGSRCEWCDTDVATYRTVVAGCDGKQVLPVVRGVTGVTGLTLTWLRTGCDGSRRDKCDWYDTDVVTNCP